MQRLGLVRHRTHIARAHIMRCRRANPDGGILVRVDGSGAIHALGVSFILQPTHFTPNSRHFHIPCPFSLSHSLSLPPIPPSLSLVLVSSANNGRQEPMSLSSSSRPIIHAFPTEMLNLSSRLNSKLRLSRIRCVFNRAKPYMSAIAVEMQGRAGQGRAGSRATE